MTPHEKLKELDKQQTAKLVLDRLLDKPIKKRSPGFDQMVYIKDSIDQKLPSELPAVAIQHLGHIDRQLEDFERKIKEKFANPKYEFCPTLQVYFKKTNIFNSLNLRVEPALHALGRINYPYTERFKSDYEKLYAHADDLRVRAKELRPLKDQEEPTRVFWDHVLSERALALIEEMRELCDAFLERLKSYYQPI